MTGSDHEDNVPDTTGEYPQPPRIRVWAGPTPTYFSPMEPRSWTRAHRERMVAALSHPWGLSIWCQQMAAEGTFPRKPEPSREHRPSLAALAELAAREAL